VLCVHDSFVIENSKAAELEKYMIVAFNEAMDEMGLDSDGEPITTLDGLGIDQFRVMMTHPEWKEVAFGFLRERYDYPGWFKKIEEFKALKLTDHYNSSNTK